MKSIGVLALHLRAILRAIQYKGWSFNTGNMGEGRYLQVSFWAGDNDDPSNPSLSHQTGRKWYISPHMTDGEIVQTAFLAIKIAEEHEMRELFLYKGQRVFGPHHDIDKLAAFAEQTGEVHRPDIRA